MAAALTEPASLDELAADYAAIYLNNSLGASPYESVWLSDDHLACAAPMFELRELYAAAGLRAADWRSRFDDHFVLQLQYLQHCCAFRQRAGRRPASSTNMSATGFPTSPSAFPCSAPRRSMPRWPN
jgi:TorA maturation chaperone TorD